MWLNIIWSCAKSSNICILFLRLSYGLRIGFLWRLGTLLFCGRSLHAPQAASPNVLLLTWSVNALSACEVEVGLNAPVVTTAPLVPFKHSEHFNSPGLESGSAPLRVKLEGQSKEVKSQKKQIFNLPKYAFRDRHVPFWADVMFQQTHKVHFCC